MSSVIRAIVIGVTIAAILHAIAAVEETERKHLFIELVDFL